MSKLGRRAIATGTDDSIICDAVTFMLSKKLQNEQIMNR
jgi:hypothetical protein